MHCQHQIDHTNRLPIHTSRSILGIAFVFGAGQLRKDDEVYKLHVKSKL